MMMMMMVVKSLLSIIHTTAIMCAGNQGSFKVFDNFLINKAIIIILLNLAEYHLILASLVQVSGAILHNKYSDSG